MKSPIKSWFLVFILILSVLSPLASAGNVAVSSYWLDTAEQSLSVMQGDLPKFAIVADSYSSSADITSVLYQNGAEVKDLLTVTNYGGEEFYRLITLNSDELSGSYQIITNIDIS